jgi:hypothetical protein
MSAAADAAIASAAFAAVAAGASWASVLQTRRERTTAREPNLSIEVSVDPTSGVVTAHLNNNGGPARSVRFAVAVQNHLAYGHPSPTPTFRAGEGRVIDTAITTAPTVPAPGFVAGIDTETSTLYVAWTGGETATYRLRGRRRTTTTDQDLMRHVLPGFDIRTATQTRFQTRDRWF